MMDLCISFSKYRRVYKPYKPIKPVRGFMQSELVPSSSPRTPHLRGLIMFITKLPKPKSLASSLMPCHLVCFHFQSASKSCDAIHVNAPFPATPFRTPQPNTTCLLLDFLRSLLNHILCHCFLVSLPHLLDVEVKVFNKGVSVHHFIAYTDCRVKCKILGARQGSPRIIWFLCVLIMPLQAWLPLVLCIQPHWLSVS